MSNDFLVAARNRATALEAKIQKAADDKDVVALIKVMDEVNEAADRVAEVKATMTKLYDRVRFSCLPDAMTDRGITNIAVDGIGKCYLQDDVSVTAVDKTQLIAWFVEHELEDLVTETVNASALSAFVKRRMKNGEELPDALLKIRPITRAVITSK
jgi:hypothetical protein